MSLWTDSETALLAEIYPHISSSVIAEMTGHSQRAVTTKARRMGLKKTADFMQATRFDYTRAYHAKKKADQGKGNDQAN